MTNFIFYLFDQHYMLYVIQLSDRVYNVTFPAYDIPKAGNVTLCTLSDSWITDILRI
jgi:hypothetical protein